MESQDGLLGDLGDLARFWEAEVMIIQVDVRYSTTRYIRLVSTSLFIKLPGTSVCITKARATGEETM